MNWPIGTRAARAGSPPYVVTMEVGGDEEVEAVDAGIAQRRLDPLRIAFVVAARAGAHQDRLAGRRDDKSRGAALDVDPVDVERAASRLRRRGDG